ncbi:hypothetical protein IVB12_09385 [Bradyrhizobium sp. 179]|uniref:hypothetical protein n=1 Tax=Bradyrhizobium sp. 179 TaxID=2782648 RepID=UPI001FF8C2C2|nr:hypothetical protein [Bradyrhizobium sp. 179]MCK1542179.1 hypothetical protein [Bradyrhizobium sp. 179]
MRASRSALLIGLVGSYSPTVVIFSDLMLRSNGSILAFELGISRQALGPETFMVFLELWIGVAVGYRLPRPNGVLRLSVRFVRDLLLGGALPLGHCQILAPKIDTGVPKSLATQIIRGAYDRSPTRRFK